MVTASSAAGLELRQTVWAMQALALGTRWSGPERYGLISSVTSDQFSLLQAGSMDVSRDQEHDRIHLRDLLTCSAMSLVSPGILSSFARRFRSPK
jgi:hypothetical protein